MTVSNVVLSHLNILVGSTFDAEDSYKGKQSDTKLHPD